MAHLDSIETRAAQDLDALYWWRRHESSEARPAEPLAQRIVALAERVTPAPPAAPTPHIIDSPGNRLRANAAMRRLADRALLERKRLDAELLAAIRHERRNATHAIVPGLLATAVPAAATLYAAATHEPVALGFAFAGSVAASFALYRTLCWILPIRPDESRRILRGSPGRALSLARAASIMTSWIRRSPRR